MTIHEMQKYAENNGFDTLKFKITFSYSGKEINCQWLDAYFGFFKVEGQEGFMTVAQLEDFENSGGDSMICEILNP